MAPTTTRRQFLAGTGALVVGFTLVRPLGAPGQVVGAKPVAIDEVDSFLSIAADGTVTLYSGKVDLGTGTRTALRQMAAEELDVPMATIDLVEGDTALTPDQGPTWGSLSIQIGGVQIRQAAATARKALLAEASRRLGVPAGELEVRGGVVRVTSDPTRTVSYGALIGDRRFDLKSDRNAPLKDPATYTVVGKSIHRVDIPAKVTGEHTYMQDFRVPGMVHARVVRPPAMGATLERVDESSVRDVKGLVTVVRLGSFLAVVTDTEWSAIKAAEKLTATWSGWEGLPPMDQLYEHVRATKATAHEATITKGDAKAGLAGAAKTVSATYEFGIQLHGSIGPSCAVAAVKDGKLTVWTASQSTHWLRRQLAEMLRMAPADIRLIYLDGAGCYGRNGHEDCAADAALLAREVGRPVRVQWMRADEHRWEPNGPPTLIDVRGGVDASGRVVGWQSELWVPSKVVTEPPPFVAATTAGLPHTPIMNPGNVHRNSEPLYEFANARTDVHYLESTPFRPSWIRTPGRMQNTYANESMMDELAAAAGIDPVEFRVQHLNDARGIAVLKAAAAKAGWKPRPSPRKDARKGDRGTGRGVSYLKYENARTYVAAVAEVEANRKTGEVRVTRVVVSQDCGLIVNPDGVRNQIEGQVIQTVSRTLIEEVKWDRSRITSVDWVSYPILRFPDVPRVDIVLINQPTQPPWGVGEPAAAVVPSAVANAIFDAIGVRVRRVPFTRDRVKSAAAVTA